MELLGVVFFKVILLLVFIFMSAKIDAFHIDRGHFFVDHKPRWVLRAVFVVGLSMQDVISFFEIAAYSLLFWALFDQVLNLARKKTPLFYIGSTAKTDSFAHLYPHVYWGSKIISIPLAILFLYIHISKNG